MKPQALIILSLTTMLTIELLALAKELQTSHKNKAKAKLYESICQIYKHFAETSVDEIVLNQEEIKMLKEQIAELQKEP